MGHPYHPREERGCILHCTLQHAQWLMQRAYRPGNARLVIVGDFDASTLLAEIRRRFEGISNPEVSLPALARLPTRTGYRRITIAAPVPRSSLRLCWSLPADFRSRRPALEVLASELELLLEPDLAGAGFSTSVRVSLLEQELSSFFDLAVRLRPGVDPKQVEARVLQRLQELRLRFPTINHARARLETNLLAEWDVPGARAQRLLEEPSLSWRLPEELAKLDAVTPAAVAQALRALPDLPTLSVSVRRAVDAPRRGQLYEEGR
jgi:zinc protease